MAVLNVPRWVSLAPAVTLQEVADPPGIYILHSIEEASASGAQEERGHVPWDEHAPGGDGIGAERRQLRRH